MITESRQRRILLIIITILFLANVATLAMFFLSKPSKRKQGEEARKERMIGYLKNELGYTDAQLETYTEISKQHKVSVDSIFSIMRRDKESRFKEMSARDFNDSSIAQAAIRVAENQKTLETKMLQHLKTVRALGNEEQRRKFDTGFLSYMSRNKSKLKK